MTELKFTIRHIVRAAGVSFGDSANAGERLSQMNTVYERHCFRPAGMMWQ